MDNLNRLSEKYIESHLVTNIELLGGKCLKWVSPGNKGVPDRIVIMPNGRVYFVEVKRPGGIISPLQEYWKREIEKLGFSHYFINSMEDLHAFIQTL